MTHPTDLAYCCDLEADAHSPEVQELIRREIHRGTMRVRPKPGAAPASCRCGSLTPRS